MKKIIMAALFLCLVAGVYGVGYSEDGSGFATFGGVRMCMSDGSVPLSGTWDFSNASVSNLFNISGVYYVEQNNATDIQAKIDNAVSRGGGSIIIPSGDYTLTSPINLSNRIKLIGSYDTTINCDAVDPCIRKNGGGRVYNVEVSDLEFTKSTDTGVGLDLTNISLSTFNNLIISNFDKAIYADGLNYYNDFYHLDLRGANYNIYYEGISNENHFFGGSIKDANMALIRFDNANQNGFFGVAFEGTNQTMNFTNFARHNNFIGSRFEFYTDGDLYFDSTSYQNTFSGGMFTLVDIHDDSGLNNFIVPDETYYMGFRPNGQKAIVINATGSGFTNTTPVLEVVQSYTSSGSPTAIKAELFRGGNLYEGWKSGTIKYKVESNNGDIWSDGISNDGTNNIVCIKSNGYLGTCSNGSACSCS